MTTLPILIECCDDRGWPSDSDYLQLLSKAKRVVSYRGHSDLIQALCAVVTSAEFEALHVQPALKVNTL